jgi:hypothetical protein
MKSSKRRSRKWLSEDIGKLILGGNKMNLNLLLCNSISEKMIIDLNMFCASMKNRIRRQISGTKVVTQIIGAEADRIWRSVNKY